jgi:hypothetical protein
VLYRIVFAERNPCHSSPHIASHFRAPLNVLAAKLSWCCCVTRSLQCPVQCVIVVDNFVLVMSRVSCPGVCPATALKPILALHLIPTCSLSCCGFMKNIHPGLDVCTYISIASHLRAPSNLVGCQAALAFLRDRSRAATLCLSVVVLFMLCRCCRPSRAARLSWCCCVTGHV